MTPLLTASGIGFDARLQPSDLRVPAATLTAIIGPNGGGKTSLLRSLARIDHPLGKVWIDDEDLDTTSTARRRALLSFLPAARDVPWAIAARDVIALGLLRDDPNRIKELLTLLELQPLASRPIDQLSTGERARVLLARALASRPKVLLLDEPLSNLDPYWVLRVLDVLSDIARRGSAVVVSLHDLTLAERFDRAVLVSGGAIAAEGSPEQVLASPLFTSAFGVERSSTGWRISRP